MPKRAHKKSSYLLPIHERIRLLKNNIRVFEERDLITRVKWMRLELERLEEEVPGGA